MLTGKVVGNIISTQKHPKLVGCKLLLVEMTFGVQNGCSEIVVAADVLGAGPGETVLLCTGSAARIALGDVNAPLDAMVVGIVDRVEKG